MLISIITQDQDGQNLFNAISSFVCTFRIGNLLHKCKAQKYKGIPVIDIFKYKLCYVFASRSIYMQLKTGSFKEAFSNNTSYHFLNCLRINWWRFTVNSASPVRQDCVPTVW